MINIANYYEWFKTIHVIAVISWMAGMLYLPRLYVYHADVEIASETDQLFKIMEHRLLRYIINPAMMITIIFGLTNAYIYGLKGIGIWFHIKMVAVSGLLLLHGFFAKCRKAFANSQNQYSAYFYRVINEVVTLFMIIAVATVIIKPFE